MNHKYPANLFIIGFVLSVLGNFFLFFPAVLLMLIGIWIKSCLIIGLVLLALDMILAFVRQLKIRYTTLNSDDPNFTIYQDAILSDNWKSNIKNLVKDAVSEPQEEDEQ